MYFVSWSSPQRTCHPGAPGLWPVEQRCPTLWFATLRLGGGRWWSHSSLLGSLAVNQESTSSFKREGMAVTLILCSIRNVLEYFSMTAVWLYMMICNVNYKWHSSIMLVDPQAYAPPGSSSMHLAVTNGVPCFWMPCFGTAGRGQFFHPPNILSWGELFLGEDKIVDSARWICFCCSMESYTSIGGQTMFLFWFVPSSCQFPILTFYDRPRLLSEVFVAGGMG